jgi:hypothetical protein
VDEARVGDCFVGWVTLCKDAALKLSCIGDVEVPSFFVGGGVIESVEEGGGGSGSGQNGVNHQLLFGTLC